MYISKSWNGYLILFSTCYFCFFKIHALLDAEKAQAHRHNDKATPLPTVGHKPPWLGGRVVGWLAKSTIWNATAWLEGKTFKRFVCLGRCRCLWYVTIWMTVWCCCCLSCCNNKRQSKGQEWKMRPQGKCNVHFTVWQAHSLRLIGT